MQPSPTVFSQIVSALYPAEFERCRQNYPPRRKPRGLSCYDQFLALCFGQLTFRESLRQIVVCLKAKESLLYHLGFHGNISRTNLAYANQHRDWQLFRELAQVLMRRASRLYAQELLDPDLPIVSFALDSSIISLSLSLFPWGYYARSKQAAVKLHLMLSLQGNLPAWAAITEVQLQDMKMIDQIPLCPGAYYIMDRGYLDFTRLKRLHQLNSFFVVRNKRHVRFRVMASRVVDKSTGLRCDQTIKLSTPWSIKSYPHKLRRIRIYDEQHQLSIILLTNQFALPAKVIAELYRKRWQVELFFKWMKQHLKVRGFYGRSPNAVYTQIWSAICAFLMVAIVKKRLKLEKNLHDILQIISTSIFEQIPVSELLAPPPENRLTKTIEEDFQKLLLLN